MEFTLSEEGLASLLGTGAYASTTAAGSSTTMHPEQKRLQAGDGTAVGDVTAPSASESKRRSNIQTETAPLWPVRLVLAYLQHLRSHGMCDWRWQELKTSETHDMMCALLIVLVPARKQIFVICPTDC